MNAKNSNQPPPLAANVPRRTLPILDEPTSAVDVETEAVIIEAMERLRCGRTTFMIAHRLSTLEICDMRIQLEHGRVGSPTRAKAETANAGAA